jgi:hypothetical protein
VTSRKPGTRSAAGLDRREESLKVAHGRAGADPDQPRRVGRRVAFEPVTPGVDRRRQQAHAAAARAEHVADIVVARDDVVDVAARRREAHRRPHERVGADAGGVVPHGVVDVEDDPPRARRRNRQFQGSSSFR